MVFKRTMKFAYVMIKSAGTSFGVSTLYLAAALRDNIATHGASLQYEPIVWGSENEQNKIEHAYKHIEQGFEGNDEIIDIKEKRQIKILQGDILDLIPKENISEDSVDALLLDIWAPLALPIVQSLERALKPGAMLFVDNAIAAENRYADLNSYLNNPSNGWKSIILPFANGFEMAVKTC